MSTLGSETLGQKVRRIREHKGIRQVDLAATAGISWRHLIRIEQDAGGNPKASTIAQLAAALEIEPTELAAPDDLDMEDRVPRRRSLADELFQMARVAAVMEQRPDLVEDILGMQT